MPTSGQRMGRPRPKPNTTTSSPDTNELDQLPTDVFDDRQPRDVLGDAVSDTIRKKRRGTMFGDSKDDE